MITYLEEQETTIMTTVPVTKIHGHDIVEICMYINIAWIPLYIQDFRLKCTFGRVGGCGSTPEYLQ
jgi:hypothetical protein